MLSVGSAADQPANIFDPIHETIPALARLTNLRFPMGSKMKRFDCCLPRPAGAGFSAAAADSPVAVVEDVQGKVTGAEFMDYVTPKAVIKIGDGGSVILSYLNSCRRETISGAGTVIVGTEESNVHLAEVKAEKTNCDSNQANATTRRDQRRRRHRAAQRRSEQPPCRSRSSPFTAHRRWWRPRDAAS